MTNTFPLRAVLGLTVSMLVAVATGCGDDGETDAVDVGGDTTLPDPDGGSDVVVLPDADAALPDVVEQDADAGTEPDPDIQIETDAILDADAGVEPELDVMSDIDEEDSVDATSELDVSDTDVSDMDVSEMDTDTTDIADVSDVVDVPVVLCGNGRIDEGEPCDPDFWEVQDCERLGFVGGEWFCTDFCTIDTSGCFNTVCGDDVCEGSETFGSCPADCLPSGFVVIDPGTFSMGSPTSEAGRGATEVLHEVTITRAFAMQTTEVTQAQWKELSGGTNPACFQTTAGNGCTTSNANDNGPVENIDWYSALAFANARSVADGLEPCYTLTGCDDPTNGWRDGEHELCSGATFVGLECEGYRLPTESEFEYAARAGTFTASYLGDFTGVVSDCVTEQPNLATIAWWCRNSFSRTQAVGTKEPNSWGLYDMLGNVREWTWDGLGDYPASATDPLGDDASLQRAARGGDWNSSPLAVRAAYRIGSAPTFRISVIGFRLVRSEL